MRKSVWLNAWLAIAVLSILWTSACGGGSKTQTVSAPGDPPPADPPPVITVLNSQTVQVNTTATFTVTITSGTPPFDYAWSVNGTEQSDSSATFAYTPNAVGNDTIGIVVSNQAGEASESAILIVQADPPPPTTPTGFAACGYATTDASCSNTSLTVNANDSLTWVFVSSPSGAGSFSLPPTETCVYVGGTDPNDYGMEENTPCWSVTDTQEDQFVAIASSTSGPIDYAVGLLDHANGGKTQLQLPSGLNPANGTLFLIDLPAGTVFNAGSWPYCPGGGNLSAGDLYNCQTMNSTSVVTDAVASGSQTSFEYNLPTACYGSGSNAGIELSVIMEDGATPLLAGAGSTSGLSISGASENALVQQTVATTVTPEVEWSSSASLSGDPLLVLNLGYLTGGSATCN
jgi:hypothetical protein